MTIDPIYTQIYALGIVFLAGFIRGYSGFGASVIIVIGLSLVFPVVEIVPVVLILEVLASGFLLPKVYQKVEWRSLSILLMGVVIGTLPGVYLLANLPDRIMRLAVSILVVILVPLLWKGVRLERTPGTLLTLTTGLFSGLFNGGAAIGGPPVVLFYFSSPTGADISRASLIAFFLVTDIIASSYCYFNGLISFATLKQTLIFIIPLVIGLFLGARFFFKSDLEVFRKRVLGLMLLLALATLVRSLVS